MNDMVIRYAGEWQGPSATGELYVQPFPVAAGHRAVSHGGGSAGRWPQGGRRRYFWDQRGKLMVASIRPRSTPAVESVREIGGDVVLATGAGQSTGLFDVAPDGRVLVAEAVPGSFDCILARNWMADLPKAAKP